MCGILFPVFHGKQEGDIQVSELEESIRCGGCGDGLCRSNRSIVGIVSACTVCYMSDRGVRKNEQKQTQKTHGRRQVRKTVCLLGE